MGAIKESAVACLLCDDKITGAVFDLYYAARSQRVVTVAQVDTLESLLSSGKELYLYLNNYPGVRDEMFNWFKLESLKGETDE